MISRGIFYIVGYHYSKKTRQGMTDQNQGEDISIEGSAAAAAAAVVENDVVEQTTESSVDVVVADADVHADVPVSVARVDVVDLTSEEENQDKTRTVNVPTSESSVKNDDNQDDEASVKRQKTTIDSEGAMEAVEVSNQGEGSAPSTIQHSDSELMDDQRADQEKLQQTVVTEDLI
jgi:hypothetical protein